jgi:putative Holliday junction resolvase
VADAAARPGVRLGVDVGSVRIGVAVCDPDGRLALPLETVRRGSGDLRRLADLATERHAVEAVVGLPRGLSGGEGPAAEAARAFAAALARVLAPLPVRLVDERLSTVAAGRDLRAAGLDTRRARGVVDQQAAAVILQAALDTERETGIAPGEVLEVGS